MTPQQLHTYEISRQSDDHPLKESEYDDFLPRRLSEKASLLRPLQDHHLLEVYKEAKRMNLSAEFIELLEEAIAQRNLSHLKED